MYALLACPDTRGFKNTDAAIMKNVEQCTEICHRPETLVNKEHKRTEPQIKYNARQYTSKEGCSQGMGETKKKDKL